MRNGIGPGLLTALLVSFMPALAEPPRQTGAADLVAFRSGPCLFMSDRPLERPEALGADLAALSQRLHADLGVIPLTAQVRVYIFSDARRFQDFVCSAIPTLARRDLNRHGIFLLRNKVPHIFVLYNDRLADSLRHEFVHATLQAAIPGLPIWLDEGLAMYYEQPAAGWNAELAESLAAGARRRWWPDLRRLEGLAVMQQMGPLEYAEAWAWVHFLLEGPNEVRPLLPAYLAELRANREAEPVSARLRNLPWDLTAEWRRHILGRLEPGSATPAFPPASKRPAATGPPPPAGSAGSRA